MASSLISRSHHIDFDSIFRLDDAKMVQMFESLITTGLKEFLGCPAIFYENALTEFFANGSIRDGLIVSTIGGIAIEISESVFAVTFALPTEGLKDLSEVPRNFISDAQRLFQVSEKEVSISCLKKELNMQYHLLSDILAKSLFVKAGSFDAKRPAARDAEVAPVITNKRTTKSKPVTARRISLEKQVEDSSTSDQPVEGVATGEQIPVAGVVTWGQIPAAEDATEDADATIKQFLNQLDLVFEKPDVAQGGLVETWFDKAFDEEFEIADRERQDTEEEIVVGFEKGTSAGDQPPASENGADGTNDDESLCIEEHQARIPFNASLPSTLAPPITQIRFGQGIEFRDVDAYTPNLPWIDISDKEKVIEDVSIFVSYFSLRKLASLQSEDIFSKEGQVLSWEKTDSSYVAIQRRKFIIAKYRELLLRKFINSRRKNFVSGTPTSAIDLKVLNLLSAAHLFALKDLLRNMKAHQLEWTRPSSSSFFEGPIIDRGSFIPVTHRSIFSKCWIRAKIMVDGSWLILEGNLSKILVNSFALEPVAPTDDQEELLYSVEVPHSPSPVVQVPESPSSSSVSPVHFDSADINLDNTAKAQSSLPAVSVDLSSLLDALQASLCQRMDDANNEIFSRLHSAERSLQTSLGHQNDYLQRLIEADTDSLDARNNFIALDAKFRSLDGQIAAIRNDQLEFQTKIAEYILGLSTQISEISDYIRSGAGKKGEVGSSSRRPLPASQPSSHVQVSVVRTQTFPPTTGTFSERVE
ncbi:hypothetical protein F511_40636 [Dorcoceras hygrometricum]|uniref:Dystroglycan-like n=1 Tax=Dorcoceras hygrometricum TaxID=472368 RepID=A0A2Z7A7I2_9LAMI|nr:hypothetical protein F511_40636 [Dorcoceras hygrometricum]